ncbi:hypothetical protein FHG89_14045 [Micromonospora orduensis]|uniref:Uncharacterized protein n=1 Tax=Micromonospora orduensis TaxID=1420891 RepID=A0A5C4QSU3_9ACTN|nr:hypothetical protein [Micromonospora orduensis]TNH28766.1 hypothetical protein FHG89_14045 [Micromonospora orduensis]
MRDDEEVEVWLLVFAEHSVVGTHPSRTRLRQGMSFVPVTSRDRECTDEYFQRLDDDVDPGHGSYLVTATLRCLGLTVHPGGTVALIRAGTDEQASIVLHQAGDGVPVPAEATQISVVRDWPGTAWAERAKVAGVPGSSPRTDWPVNTALRALGVERGDHPDEATALGLTLPT